MSRRNARERNRVKQVNCGFTTLRDHIPHLKNKTSKVDTLRAAVEYIQALRQLLGEEEIVLDKNDSANQINVSVQRRKLTGAEITLRIFIASLRLCRRRRAPRRVDHVLSVSPAVSFGVRAVGRDQPNGLPASAHRDAVHGAATGRGRVVVIAGIHQPQVGGGEAASAGRLLVGGLGGGEQVPPPGERRVGLVAADHSSPHGVT